MRFCLFDIFWRFIISRFVLRRFFTGINFATSTKNHKYREILYLQNLISLI